MKRPISAAIITKNEEGNIERCLRALDWVDEIVVVDSGSTDRTLEICAKYRCKTIKAEWLGYGRNKRLAVDSASNNWVLAVDADEEVTPELAREIQDILSRDEVKDGYKIRWRSMYLGRWIRHSGWNRFYKLKLFDRTRGNYTDDVMHETVRLKGEVGRFKNALRHYTYPDLATVARKMEANTTMAARVLCVQGKRPSLFTVYLHAGWTFLRMYVFKAGFLDGRIGLILATDYAYTVYLKYLKCWEKTREAKP
jgi:glycosyltransferase involved in cell wall biosynthesis